MPALCDVVLEAAGAHAVEQIVTTSLKAGKSVVVVSCGALLGRDDLFEMARRNGARIHVPSGAIIGLDGLLAASEGRIDNITMITRKPPEGLKGSPGVEMAGIDLDAITEATEVFEGPVSEGFKRFPANVNVAAAVSMAGIGPDKTRIRVIADPAVTRNTHDVVAEGEFGKTRVPYRKYPLRRQSKDGTTYRTVSAGLLEADGIASEYRDMKQWAHSQKRVKVGILLGMLGLVLVISLIGCNRGSESGEHSRGSESGESGEESGTQFALGDTFDEVRSGARLVLSYDSTANAFKGTVENTTGTHCAGLESKSTSQTGLS